MIFHPASQVQADSLVFDIQQFLSCHGLNAIIIKFVL